MFVQAKCSLRNYRRANSHESLLMHSLTGPGARLRKSTEGMLREANGRVHLSYCNQESKNEAKE